MTALSNYTPGFRLVDGTQLNLMVTAVNNITGNGTPAAGTFTTITASSTIVATGNVTGAAGSFTNLTTNGTRTASPQLLTAAGATQGNAAAITGALAIITVSTTASTHGVKLPTAATGLIVEVANLGTFGVKVYPSTNGKIGAASTNAADTTVLAINKANQYIALNTTRWAVLRGA